MKIFISQRSIPPLSFGISTLLTGDGLYLPFLILSSSSFLCSCSQGSASSTVIPSTPLAPLLAFTRLQALFRLSPLSTFSSRSAPSFRSTSRLSVLYASEYSQCSTLSLCRKPPFSAYSVFIIPTSFSFLLGTYNCSVLSGKEIFFSPPVL